MDVIHNVEDGQFVRVCWETEHVFGSTVVEASELDEALTDFVSCGYIVCDLEEV